MSTTDDPLSRGLFGPEGYVPARPRKQVFLPWHRPRKQFVRREQWIRQARDLMATRPETDSLRYLGLPGDDLMDLRYMHQQLCADGRPMAFLGFNTSAGGRADDRVELNISLDEVRRLPNVDSRSRVIGDDFRSIARPQSVAWQTLQELGPFDIVNIDLCDGLFMDQPLNGQVTIYEAIAKLFGAQRVMRHPWLLLVTSRIGRSHVEPDAANRLLKTWTENLDNCEGFRDESSAYLLPETVQPFDLATASSAVAFQVLVASMCKWILGLAVAGGSEATFPSSISYRINADDPHDDLVSLAVRIEPITSSVPDKAGLSAPNTEQPDECKCAKRIPRRVGKTRQADSLLSADPSLLNDLIQESEELLTLSRYDIAGYQTWLTT